MSKEIQEAIREAIVEARRTQHSRLSQHTIIKPKDRQGVSALKGRLKGLQQAIDIVVALDEKSKEVR